VPCEFTFTTTLPDISALYNITFQKERDEVLVLVGAEVCLRCGEAYYTPKTVEKLVKIRERLKVPAGQTYLYKGEVEA